MGEFNKPELVTVRPLTNPNEPSNRTINVPTAANNIPRSSGLGGGGSGQPMIVNVNIQGNDIIDDRKLTYKINNTAGKRRGQAFR